MSAVGEVVGDDVHVCHPSERTTARRMDTPPAWDPVGLLTSPSTIHTGCGCASSVHSSAVPERLPREASVAKGPSTTIRRSHFHVSCLYSLK